MNKTHTPQAAENLRVSHAEREPVIEQLKQAYADGRIDHVVQFAGQQRPGVREVGLHLRS